MAPSEQGSAHARTLLFPSLHLSPTFSLSLLREQAWNIGMGFARPDEAACKGESEKTCQKYNIDYKALSLSVPPYSRGFSPAPLPHTVL